VLGEQRTPLVFVLLAGGEKSLLSMTPARVDDPGMTIVVVPHQAYVNHLVITAATSTLRAVQLSTPDRLGKQTNQTAGTRLSIPTRTVSGVS
jgi:hypothetical protein